MHINIKNILQFPSLNQSELITGEEGVSNLVTDALIMEALDIEEWGQPGQLLLTSYFAFENTGPKVIEHFFAQANEIGIAGFIFKTARLVSDIPVDFIEECKKYQLPLIRITKDIAYPKIINEILSAISNNNAFLLKAYYDNHQQFIQLMMKQADFSQILKTLKDLIHLPVTLNEKINNHQIGTDDKYKTFKIIRQNSIKSNNNIQYKKQFVQYENSKKVDVVLSFSIPNLGYEDYELLIHQTNAPLIDLQFMSIENAVVALQTELVKRYALQRNNFSHLNEMASALIFGQLTNKDDIHDTIHHLKLDISKKYRVVVLNFNHSNKEKHSAGMNRFMQTVANFSKTYFHDLVYIQQSHEIIAIIPIDHYDLKTVKNKLSDLLDEVMDKTVNDSFISQISISDEVSVYNLPVGYKQATDTLLISGLWGDKSSIDAYEEIGIFKLFIEADNLNAVKHFVPKIIWDLQEKNPDLLKTLDTFISVNQNYSKTAEILFIHPKTVRYRVNQLIDQYSINFDDPDEIFQYNVAMRIIKFINHKDKTN